MGYWIGCPAVDHKEDAPRVKSQVVGPARCVWSRFPVVDGVVGIHSAGP